MEEIMQLERVTVAASAMSIESVENTRMDGVARRSYTAVLDFNDWIPNFSPSAAARV
jgi:hypothetical protein